MATIASDATVQGAAASRPEASTGAPTRRELLLAIALCEAAGLPGIPPTFRAIRDGWYDALDKPSWTPPKGVFGRRGPPSMRCRA